MKQIQKCMTGLFIAYMMISGNMMAQQVKVRGIVVDSLTRIGEPYATVRIYSAENDKEAVTMGATDMDGHFEQIVDKRGTYRALFSSVGRRNVDIPFTIPQGSLEFNLDTISMSDDAMLLSGVEIVAQRPLVKMEVDKLSYSVESDIDAKSNSVLDMLRKVPMVTVDGNDNITVNGSSSFKVYVDGKPNVMMSNNPSEIFKSMPASSIKDIEVITNPGARYDAEGAGGVLNLITNRSSSNRKQLLNNYSGTVRGMALNRGAGGSAFFSMQKDKFSMSLNANTMWSFPVKAETDLYREQLENSIPMKTHSEMKNNYQIQMGNVNLGYEIDSLNLISASTGIMSFGMGNTGDMITDLNGLNYITQSKNDARNYSINGSIDYQHISSKNKERILTLSYLISASPQRNKNYNWFETNQENDYIDLTDRYSHAKNNTVEHTWQVDFTTPLIVGHKLDLGAKYILRDNSARSDYYNQIDNVLAWDKDNSLDYIVIRTEF